MTTEELDELERNANAATPGERVKIGSTVVPEHSNQGHWENDPPDWVEWMSNGSYKKMHEDMIFIAACDPQTILRLIAAARENAALRERVKELEGRPCCFDLDVSTFVTDHDCALNRPFPPYLPYLSTHK